MSNKPSTTTTTQQSSQVKGPLAAQLGLYKDLWGKTKGVIDAPTPTDFVAGASQPSYDAVANLLATAPGLSANAGGLRDIAGKVAGGYFLDPSNDPTFAGAANAAITPITQQLTEKVLPQITDASIRNAGVGGGPGAYGGARQDIQENQAIRDWSQTAGDITAKLAATSRAQGMDLIKTAPALDTAASTAALLPGNVMGQAGAALTGFDQADLNNEIAKWLGPLSALQPAAGIAATGGFSQGTMDSTGTQTTPAPSMATQWLQGLTGAAGIAGSLFGLPGLGAAGGLLGPMMGFMQAGTNPQLPNGQRNPLYG